MLGALTARILGPPSILRGTHLPRREAQHPRSLLRQACLSSETALSPDIFRAKMSSWQHPDAAPLLGSANSRFSRGNSRRLRPKPASFKPLRRLSATRLLAKTAHRDAAMAQGLKGATRDATLPAGRQNPTIEPSIRTVASPYRASEPSSDLTTPPSARTHRFRSSKPRVSDQSSAARFETSRMTLNQDHCTGAARSKPHAASLDTNSPRSCVYAHIPPASRRTRILCPDGKIS